MRSKRRFPLPGVLLGVVLAIAHATRLSADASLPGGSDSRDIGSVGIAGDASYANGTYTVSGSGADIWGTADAFHYVSFPKSFGATGAFEARVTSEQFTNQYAKAGIMLRKTYDASSAHVVLDVKPDGSVEFMTRPQDGSPTQFIAGASSVFPIWLKLSYDSSTVSAQISTDGTTWSTIASTPFANGNITYIGLAVTSHDTAQVNRSIFDNIEQFLDSLPDALPSPWRQTNVGSVGQPGGSTYSTGTFTVSGSGADIWGTSDAFHYVYAQIANDPTQNHRELIMTRVLGMQNTSGYAKAGVMLRESLDPGAGDVILDVKPDGGIEFMSRLTAGAATSFIGGTSQPMPAWVRLNRDGDVISGWVSADDQSWQKVGEVAVSWPEDVAYVGLAVTSHDNAATNTAAFDNALLGYSTRDIGDVGAAGSAAEANEQWTIAGSGGDIWGVADAFHYTYLPFGTSTAHSVSLRVRSVQNTSPYAKAGIMIRESTAPDAAHVLLDVKPDGGVEFMQRSATNEATTFIAGTSLSFSTGVWLRLVRYDVDQTVSAYVMSDADVGVWTLVGTTTMSISPNSLIGLAVTSHSRGTLNTVVFERITADP